MQTKEERRAYSRGYAAGQRKLDRSEQREEFRRQAFLAALPACINATGWTNGDGEKINTLPQRVRLAVSAASCALKHFTF